MQDIKLMIQHLKKYIPCEINCQITNYTHKYLRLDSLSLWSQSVFSVREVSQKKLRDAHFKLFKDWQYTNLAVCNQIEISIDHIAHLNNSTQPMPVCCKCNVQIEVCTPTFFFYREGFNLISFFFSAIKVRP